MRGWVMAIDTMIEAVELMHDDGTEDEGIRIEATLIGGGLDGASAIGRASPSTDHAVAVICHPVADVATLDPATVGAAVIAALESV